jgi:hypothetical protein
MKIEDSKGAGHIRVEWNIKAPDDEAIAIQRRIKESVMEVASGNYDDADSDTTEDT